MAVLTAISADVGCNPFSRSYVLTSKPVPRLFLPAMPTMRQSIRFLSVAARSKREIPAVTYCPTTKGLNMVVIIIYPGHFNPCMRIVFTCMNFPVDNILCSNDRCLRF